MSISLISLGLGTTTVFIFLGFSWIECMCFFYTFWDLFRKMTLARVMKNTIRYS